VLLLKLSKWPSCPSHPRLLFLWTAHKLIIYAPESMITTPTPGRLLVMLEHLPSTTRSLSFLT